MGNGGVALRDLHVGKLVGLHNVTPGRSDVQRHQIIDSTPEPLIEHQTNFEVLTGPRVLEGGDQQTVVRRL